MLITYAQINNRSKRQDATLYFFATIPKHDEHGEKYNGNKAYQLTILVIGEIES